MPEPVLQIMELPVATSKQPTLDRIVPGAVVAPGAWSIRGWCAYRGYSVATFYVMKKNGTAPAVLHPPHAPPRITIEADRAWIEACNNLPDDKAAQTKARDAERKARTLEAGKAAAESERHISKRPHRPISKLRQWESV